MLENSGICTLLGAEIAGQLGQVLLISQLLLILGQILPRTQLASQRLFSETANDVAKLLRVLVQYWLLAY